MNDAPHEIDLSGRLGPNVNEVHELSHGAGCQLSIVLIQHPDIEEGEKAPASISRFT